MYHMYRQRNDNNTRIASLIIIFANFSDIGLAFSLIIDGVGHDLKLGDDKQEIKVIDENGDALDGSKQNYILHFSKDRLPPVKAFWSFSMYKMPEQLFTENSINRYVISSATDGLQYNKDGSLDIYIQKDKKEGGRQDFADLALLHSLYITMMQYALLVQ